MRLGDTGFRGGAKWHWVFYPAFNGNITAQHCYNGDVSFLWEKWKL